MLKNQSNNTNVMNKQSKSIVICNVIEQNNFKIRLHGVQFAIFLYNSKLDRIEKYGQKQR